MILIAIGAIMLLLSALVCLLDMDSEFGVYACVVSVAIMGAGVGLEL